MKTQLTTRYGIIVALSVILFCGSLWAGGSFLDDFSDGDAQDGSPVTWGWDADGLGERLVTPEGFHLEPNPGMVPWAALLDDEGNDVIYAGNMTIRMQLKVDHSENWGNTGVYFRANRTGDYYQAGIILNQLYLARMSNWTWTVFSQPVIPGFSPTGQDIIIQIDVTDFTDATGQPTSRLEVYSWFPGQDKPSQPQISMVDATFAEGGVAVYADRCSATYRWVEVITEPTEPVVDFNGDGTVDTQDLLKMIRSWGQDDLSVDLVPDGVVDEADLEVLMDSWGQDVNDATLLAHWALDETDGDVAYDRVGLNDATLLGAPIWNPTGGQIDGALALDGQDDCGLADPVCNPASGPFSVLAWIQAGASGQVLVSQAGGTDWLSADPIEGCLMTGSSGGARPGSALCSEAAIIDGDWHRVALVWDGTRRGLYVDDVLAAEDGQSSLEDCFGGLNIGCGVDMTAGTFFSGLIDDVRIYNRAVKP